MKLEIARLGPYTDPNGVVSPAGWGSRARDASGALVHDQVGLVAVTTSLGLAANSSSQVVAAGAGWVDITSSSFSITVPRQVKIDYRVFMTGWLTTSGAGNSTQIRGNIVGFNTSAAIYMGSSTIDSDFIWYYGTIPAGTYTVKMQANATGSDFNVTQFFHQVFSLGT